VQYALRFLLLSVACLLAANAGSQEAEQEIDAVADIFLSEGIVATLVVASLVGDTVHTYNDGRSLQRFSPASTFKIPNTLIALNAQLVTSKNSQFVWDGTDKGLDRWNKDQTLESAFKVSCVWCYQEIARNVGAEQYEQALAMLDYGNQSVGNEIDAFWLNGELRISAIEQIEFLRKIYNYEVPFRREHVDLLKDIMLTEQTSSYAIYAKTGWAATTPQVGWYVGFVVKSEEAWLFAMNLQVDRREQVALRKELTNRSLRSLRIIQ
jgi:beta-lactamase class D